MLHFIIVENLKTDCEKLRQIIQADFDAQMQSINFSFYENGEKFLRRYRPGSCNALFLNITPRDMSGMDIARKIWKKEPRLPIIFTTSGPDSVPEEDVVHATDYLVKPLNPAKVSLCLKNLREYLSVPSFLTLPEINGRAHSTPVKVPLDNILYGQYRNYHMELHMITDIVYARLSFHEFIALLPQSARFHVCGRGLFVNFSHVENVLGGELLLKTGEKLFLSHDRRSEVQQAYSSWAFFRCRKNGWG